jgi:putative Mn2+ efflux pump MntP
MKLTEIVITAISLASDAIAATVGRGISNPERSPAYVIKTAAAFGLFQAIMPTVGWSIGSAVSGVVDRVAPFVSFALLCGVGVGMIRDSVAKDDTEQKKKPTLIGLAIATSIDALSAGVGLGLYRAPILLCSLIIGGVTFALSLLGVLLGGLLGIKWGRGATFVGGILLCGIGIKILAEAFITAFLLR